MRKPVIRRFAPVVLATVLLLVTAACGESSESTGADPEAGGITVADQWVKATEGQSMADMSAGFGVLSNSGDEDVKVTGVKASVTDRAELHETVDGEMKQVDAFTIPAGGSLTLEPGGNHLMLLDLKDPIKPGAEVEFTLTFEDDSTVVFKAPAKDFAGAEENYDDGMDMDMDSQG